MDPIHLASNAVLALGLVAGAVSDLKHRRIPNALPLALLVAFVVFALLGTAPDWPWRLFWALVVFVAGWAAFLARAMGGGDVKLLAAASLYFAPAALPRFMLCVAIAGGLQAAVWIVLRRSGRLGRADGRMPYALSIAVAGLATSLWV